MWHIWDSGCRLCRNWYLHSRRSQADYAGLQDARRRRSRIFINSEALLWTWWCFCKHVSFRLRSNAVFFSKRHSWNLRRGIFLVLSFSSRAVYCHWTQTVKSHIFTACCVLIIIQGGTKQATMSQKGITISLTCNFAKCWLIFKINIFTIKLCTNM